MKILVTYFYVCSKVEGDTNKLPKELENFIGNIESRNGPIDGPVLLEELERQIEMLNDFKF